MRLGTLEGTLVGDLEVKKEQIRNIVRAHKVCATKEILNLLSE